MYLFHNKNVRLFKISKIFTFKMPKHCSVKGCRIKYGQGIILRRFPRDVEKNKKWKERIGMITSLSTFHEKKKIQKRAFGSKSMAMRAIVR